MAETLASLLLRVAATLGEADLPFMVVGSLAVAAHGAPRSSNDVDLVAHIPFESIDRVRDALQRAGFVEIDERRDEWGRRLVVGSGEFTAEVFITPPQPPYDEEFAGRVWLDVGGQRLPFIGAPALVLRKLVNTRLRRGQDYDDVVGILQVQGAAFDHAYVRARAGTYRVADLFERAVKDAAESEPVN